MASCAISIGSSRVYDEGFDRESGTLTLGSATAKGQVPFRFSA